jgi:hypothetical protein
MVKTYFVLIFLIKTISVQSEDLGHKSVRDWTFYFSVMVLPIRTIWWFARLSIITTAFYTIIILRR